MKQEDCIFDKIHLIKQKIPKHAISSLLEIMYNHICFSTFPYLVYKEKSSIEAVQKYNSGNCIALSEYFMMLLKNNYNVESSLIVSCVLRLSP